ncbi:hypothetical protein [Anoxybacteroides amylolyticum]|uniref:Uncharacterized protein n=1 Tax=Anoxybacteroides amylolyticum TaxID=294699 RepID=A0A160F5L2_9BACL|nr:hypothetical protein [Anoxybacillus amylolyticus]ANB61817.1 hypothetical protein GFC30_1342 [Anoxybacillus amylolyticus]
MQKNDRYLPRLQKASLFRGSVDSTVKPKRDSDMSFVLFYVAQHLYGQRIKSLPLAKAFFLGLFFHFCEYTINGRKEE